MTYKNTIRLVALGVGLVLGVFMSLTARPVAFAKSPQEALAHENDCSWVADSLITCADYEYWFDPVATAENKKITFQFKDGGTYQGVFIFPNSDGSQYTLSGNRNGSNPVGSSERNLIDNSRRKTRFIADGGNNPNNKTELDQTQWKEHTIFADGMYDNNNNGVADANESYFYCGIESLGGQKCWSGWWVNNPGPGAMVPISAETGAIIKGLREGLDETIGADAQCDNDAGSLSFVLCPLLNVSRKAITSLIGNGTGEGFLIELLTVPPLSATNANDATHAIWSAFRDIALSLYILIFIVIIFGNAFGADAYTVKRTLPRLAIGALLTASSFFIVQTMVDISNVLGNAIPALISAVSKQTVKLDAFQLDFNIAGQSVAIILVLILVFLALAALLIALAGLIARSLIVYALILTAPFAFVAWVLPNTEKLFKKWWTEFIKVLMMFPIVTGMLAISLLFQQISTSDPNAGFAVKLAGLAAPLVALMFIPKTFKMGGALFVAAAGYAAGKASQARDWGGKHGRSGVDRVQQRTASNLSSRAEARLGEKADGSDPTRRDRAAARALTLGAAVGSGRLPTRRGRHAVAQARGQQIAEEQKFADTEFSNMGGARLTTELTNAGQDLRRSPNSARALARFRAAQARATQTGATDALVTERARFVQSGDFAAMNAFNTATGANMGEISKKAPDAGIINVGDVTGRNGPPSHTLPFNSANLSFDQLAELHHSTIARLSQPDPTTGAIPLANIRSDVWNRLSDPRNQGRVNGNQLNALAGGLVEMQNHINAAVAAGVAPDPNVNAAFANLSPIIHVATVVDPTNPTRQIVQPGTNANFV